MSITYKELKALANLTEDKPKTIVIDLNGEDDIITIKQFVSSEQIDNMLQIINDFSFEKDRFSPVRYTIAVQFAIIQLYTDIRFTVKEKEKLYEIYDTFDKLGLFQRIIDAIDEKEYMEFVNMAKESIEHESKYRSTLSAAIAKMGDMQYSSFDPSMIDNLNIEDMQKMMSIINKNTDNDENKDNN